jgi:hypothetical protein
VNASDKAMASLQSPVEELISPSSDSRRTFIGSASQDAPNGHPLPMNSLDSKAGDGKADLRPVPTRSEIKVESRSELKVQSSLEGSATAFERRAHIENLQEMADKARENGGTPPVSVEARLAVARSDLDKFEASTVYQRAQAFDRLPQNEALGNFPELDASFKQLQAVKRDWTPQTSQDLREREYFGAKAQLSDQLHRGDLPKAQVSLEESRSVIQMAAAARGLVVRDAQEIKQDFRGEVVAQSSHHVLLQVSDIQYEKGLIARSLRVLAIQYGQDKSQVHAHESAMVPVPAQNKETSRERAVGQERDWR